MWFKNRHLVIGLGAVLIALPINQAKADLYSETLSQIHRGDYTHARNRLITLAKQGHGKAQFQLGLMYHRGKGVPQNYRKAVKWYRDAADANNAGACNNLGVIYRDGLGMPRSDVMAYMWFALAASQEIGSGLGLKNRDALAQKMTPGDILQAQQLAEEYLESLDAGKYRQLASAKPAAATPKPVKMRSPKPAPAKTMTDAGAAPLAAIPKQPVKMAAAPIVKPATAAPKKPAPPAKVVVVPLTTEPAPKIITASPPIKKFVKKKAPAMKTPTPIAVLAMSIPVKPAKPDPDPVVEKRYLVQLGLFGKLANVRRVRTKLSSLGIGLQVKDVTVRGSRYQRLRIGPFASSGTAKAMARRVDVMFRIKSLLIPEFY